MSQQSHCRCLLCGMERHLAEQFAGPRQNAYQQFATSLPVLSSFAAASSLISYLHTEQSAGNGTPSKDGILAELLDGTTDNGRTATSRELLLLAFVPMLHRISRQVVTRFPFLSQDDVAQHVVTTLLESLDSAEFAGRHSHVAFAIARFLRRNAFAWAAREGRGTLNGFGGMESLERAANRDGPQPIERVAMLRHFLDRCLQRGVLSSEDLQQLVQFKLGELLSADTSNASRQRMKRLLGKLRRAARRPGRRNLDDRQLCLF
jgi:hypothetical protein